MTNTITVNNTQTVEQTAEKTGKLSRKTKFIIFVTDMITRNYIKIYKVSHRGLREPELVVANDLEDALRKFNEFWDDDIDIWPDGVTGVELAQTIEVIDDSEKYEQS